MEGKSRRSIKGRKQERFQSLKNELTVLGNAAKTITKSKAFTNHNVDRRISFELAMKNHMCSTLNSHILKYGNGVQMMVDDIRKKHPRTWRTDMSNLFRTTNHCEMVHGHKLNKSSKELIDRVLFQTREDTENDQTPFSFLH